MSTNWLKRTVLIPLALSVAACASGASISETPKAQTSIPEGKTRIVVYRTQVLGAAIQPEVLVDGQPTGNCQPNGAFLVDVPAGIHTVSASTESTATAKVDTSDSPIAYVECSIGFGLFIGRPKLVPVMPETGAAVSNDLVLTGRY
jgi:hypothetical protein